MLTAAHCIYNRAEGHFAYANEPRDEQPPNFVTQWGTDYGRGFACLGGDIDSSSEFAEVDTAVHADHLDDRDRHRGVVSRLPSAERRPPTADRRYRSPTSDADCPDARR